MPMVAAYTYTTSYWLFIEGASCDGGTQTISTPTPRPNLTQP